MIRFIQEKSDKNLNLNLSLIINGLELKHRNHKHTFRTFAFLLFSSIAVINGMQHHIKLYATIIKQMFPSNVCNHVPVALNNKCLPTLNNICCQAGKKRVCKQ